MTRRLVIVGGLLVSQLITLYVTPVVYTYLDEFTTWLARKRAPKQRAVEMEPVTA